MLIPKKVYQKSSGEGLVVLNLSGAKGGVIFYWLPTANYSTFAASVSGEAYWSDKPLSLETCHIVMLFFFGQAHRS